MAVNLQPAGRSRKRQKRAPMSEINVTPLVDVMLVLLVIFMITAPLLTFGVPVDLPEMATSKLVAESEGPPSLEVSVNRRNEVFIQGTQVPMAQLVPRLEAVTRNWKGTRILIRGDHELAYGRVMAVMDAVNRAGYRHVVLITRLPARPDKER